MKGFLTKQYFVKLVHAFVYGRLVTVCLQVLVRQLQLIQNPAQDGLGHKYISDWLVQYETSRPCRLTPGSHTHKQTSWTCENCSHLKTLVAQAFKHIFWLSYFCYFNKAFILYFFPTLSSLSYCFSIFMLCLVKHWILLSEECYINKCALYTEGKCNECLLEF